MRMHGMMVIHMMPFSMAPALVTFLAATAAVTTPP